MTSRFIHRPADWVDPAFLHEERVMLKRSRSQLEEMQNQLDHLDQDIERSRTLAKAAGVSPPPTRSS